MERKRGPWGGIIISLMLGISGFAAFGYVVGSAYEDGGFWGSRFQTQLMGLLVDITLVSEAIAAIMRRVKGSGRQDNTKNKYVYANWVTIAAYIIFGTEFAIAFGRIVFASGAAGARAGAMDILCMVAGVAAVVAGIVICIMKLRRRNFKKNGGADG